MGKAKIAKKLSKGVGGGGKRGAGAPVDDGGALVRRLLAKYPEPTVAETRAFTRQCSDAVARAYGGRTRAINVLHDAERFASTMQTALAAPKGGLSYGRSRFRFFLGLVDSLRASIDKDRGARANTGAAKDGAEAARREALLARELLVERMWAFADGHVVRKGLLSKALLDTKTDDLVLASMLELAKLARKWVAAGSEEDRALASSVALDERVIAQVDGARAKLAEAHGDRLDAGSKVARDSAATNALEGRVLFEMRHAMRLFDGAHARDARAPRLVPSSGTRGVLAPHRGAAEGAGEGETVVEKAAG